MLAALALAGAIACGSSATPPEPSRLGTTDAVALSAEPARAGADVVLHWNEIAVNTASDQNPFAQARFAAITQLAVFEAVNAITRDYEPYLGSVVAPHGASADAAAIVAAHRVLRTYFPASASTLDDARANSLALVADGKAKEDGIATGEAAAAAMILLRANDGSSPAQFKVPGPAVPGEWQATPSCPIIGGIAVGAFFHWQNVTPFGIPSARKFLLEPPPELTSKRYAKDYIEVMTVGSATSTNRPQDRADVVLFYQVSSPTLLFNLAARQIARAQARSMSENAQAFALMNMATNDSLVASFLNKYFYNLWRPETAIRAGDTDGNSKTHSDLTFLPFITTPCFPSYPSNHASGSNGAAKVLRHLYGEGGHSITLSNPVVPNIILHYTAFEQITDDVDDARIYGGIHFRFDQVAGARLGRHVAKSVYKHNLRAVHGRDQGEDNQEDGHGGDDETEDGRGQ
jgi:hypothetical protein